MSLLEEHSKYASSFKSFASFAPFRDVTMKSGLRTEPFRKSLLVPKRTILARAGL